MDGPQTLSGPVQQVLEPGLEDDTLPCANPEADAATIVVIVLELISNTRTERQRLTLGGARVHVLRFAVGALRSAPEFWTHPARVETTRRTASSRTIRGFWLSQAS
jgi:hypothetical protein